MFKEQPSVWLQYTEGGTCWRLSLQQWAGSLTQSISEERKDSTCPLRVLFSPAAPNHPGGQWRNRLIQHPRRLASCAPYIWLMGPLTFSASLSIHLKHSRPLSTYHALLVIVNQQGKARKWLILSTHSVFLNGLFRPVLLPCG